MSTYTPIASQTLSSAASSVTFSNIPQTYTDLVLVINGTSNQDDTVGLQFNSDTGTNYSATRLSGNGTTASSGRWSSISQSYYGVFYTTTTNAIIDFQNYSNATTYKTFIARSNNASNDVRTTVGLWRNTAAITSIKLTFFGASTYSSGSTFNLYGIDAQASVLAKATGGQTITKDANYWYHVFNSSGTFTPSQSVTADILVIAGGGGAGYNNGGGGGAGGLLAHNSQSLTSGTSYTITIGAGGVENTGNGSNSQFGSLTASSLSGYATNNQLTSYALVTDLTTANIVENGITQLDLYYLIQFKMGKEIGMDRISNLVNGKKTNINMDTAKTICKALEVTYDDIFDVD